MPFTRKKANSVQNSGITFLPYELMVLVGPSQGLAITF